MPKVNPHADPTRRDLGPAALGRTVKKLFSYYPVLAPVTFVCILFSSIVSSVPSLFTQNIIQIIEKWYISRDWAAAKAEIVPYLTLLVVLYALSILSMTVYTQLMAYMTQGFLHKLRCEMFGGMQKLPIRYFDSHQHGDIMSHYTNDIDTLRQLVSQALPALIQSGAIVLVVFSIMLYFSLWLTLVLVLGIIAMVAVTKKIGGGSAKYFVRQQKAVASTEGFIQEMMAGQKVVKVFCHEQKSIEDFDRLNDALFEDSFRAQAYASVLGPIIGNIGNILYVTLALVGGVFLLIGLPNVSLSGKALDISILVPFLNMARQFTGNVNQLSQQINAVVMAGAGAQRVFALIDEKPETDDGYVTLVNAEIAPDGTVTESDRRTGHWAWKHPHGDGTLTYTELRGDVRLTDVDFAYTEGKDVLHDVSVYAEPGQKVAFVGATGAGKTTITATASATEIYPEAQASYELTVKAAPSHTSNTAPVVKPGTDDSADAATEKLFSDVPKRSAYFKAIKWAVESGITNGTGDGMTFSPDEPCTRAQMAMFLWRAAKTPEPKTLSSFTDVSANAYYAKAVAWAVENGITNGTENGSTFSPNEPCTRAQMVVFLCRLANGAPKGSRMAFTDVNEHAYYVNAVLWAVEAGITNGTGNGTTFSPNEPCTRAQMVTFLYRYFVK